MNALVIPAQAEIQFSCLKILDIFNSICVPSHVIIFPVEIAIEESEVTVLAYLAEYVPKD